MRAEIVTVASLLLAVSPIARGANRAIVFGGNCEVSGADNMFQTDMARVSRGLRDKNWEVAPLFDGDYSRNGRSNATWSTAPFGKDVPRASKAALLEALANAAKNAKEGDQLFLSISTHGSRAEPGKAHGICLDDGTEMPVNDPEFTGALQKVKDQGVRIGIADSSCYGGGSVKELSRFGCVISTSSERIPANGLGVTLKLADLLEASPETLAGQDLGPRLGGPADGKTTMEELFLNTLISGARRRPPRGYQGTGPASVWGGYNQAQISGFPDLPDQAVLNHLFVFGGIYAAKPDRPCLEPFSLKDAPGFKPLERALSEIGDRQLMEAYAGERIHHAGALLETVDRNIEAARQMAIAEAQMVARSEAALERLYQATYRIDYQLPAGLRDLKEVLQDAMGSRSCHPPENGSAFCSADADGMESPPSQLLHHRLFSRRPDATLDQYYRHAVSEVVRTAKRRAVPSDQAKLDRPETRALIEGMLRDSETAAWNRQPTGVRAQVERDVQTFFDARAEQSRSGDVGTVLRQSLGENTAALRGYQYLGHRKDRAPDCSDFVLFKR